MSQNSPKPAPEMWSRAWWNAAFKWTCARRAKELRRSLTGAEYREVARALLVARRFVGRRARIRIDAPIESYWTEAQHKREDSIELRDQQLVGTIGQANEWGCFLMFDGRDGRWYEYKDLEIFPAKVEDKR